MGWPSIGGEGDTDIGLMRSSLEDGIAASDLCGKTVDRIDPLELLRDGMQRLGADRVQDVAVDGRRLPACL